MVGVRVGWQQLSVLGMLIDKNQKKIFIIIN